MTGTRIFYVGLALLAVGVAYWGWKLLARGAYESAEYVVVQSERPFEIRDYPRLMMATTDMRFASQGGDGSFMRLFRYISGANDAEQKVAMTTPVFMEPDSTEQSGQMGFVIPKKFAPPTIPQPSDAKVQIQPREGGRFAVIRFAGQISRQSCTRAEETLRSWMKGKGLSGDDEVELAGYDPPWTPGPFRRNEVLIRLR